MFDLAPSTNILRVDGSMRRNGSDTRMLTDQLLAQMALQQDIQVVTRDLADGIALVNEDWIDANFTPEADRTAQQRDILAASDQLVAELEAADTIVLGLPVYNFHAPAAVKAWIDQIARVGRTFRYTADGPQGLLKGKRAIVVVASGGTSLGSEIDYVSDYIAHILGFVGIDDVAFVDGSAGKTVTALDTILAA